MKLNFLLINLKKHINWITMTFDGNEGCCLLQQTQDKTFLVWREGAVLNFVCGARRRRSAERQSNDVNTGELVTPKEWQERL
jgi:hypothetical protein